MFHGLNDFGHNIAFSGFFIEIISSMKRTSIAMRNRDNERSNQELQIISSQLELSIKVVKLLPKRSIKFNRDERSFHSNIVG